MRTRHLSRLFGAAAVAAGAIVCTTSAPAASAAPCPDVDLVFARGTSEAPGVGGVGQSYVDALRAQLGPKTLDVYPVDYAASSDFNNREAFASSVIDGVRDAGTHVEATAANCPNTKIVLGGYSQGAIVAGYVTANQVPAGVPASVVPAPLPASVADHVAAVTLFGKPDGQFMNMISQPQVAVGPLYAGKTLDSCVPGDPICSTGGDYALHNAYISDGLVDQAATYAAGRLEPTPTPAPER